MEYTVEYTAERAAQLKKNLQKVEEEIAEAAEDRTGARTADSVLPQLTVVTKFFPASDVMALYDLGVRHVGENRDQEASEKARQLAYYSGAQDRLSWAYIGQLQTNKAKSVVKYASEVHSVDRASLVTALGKAYANQLARYEAAEGPSLYSYDKTGLTCLIQVNLDEQAQNTAGQAAQGQRGGASPDSLEELAELIEATDYLRCGGVMAVAPLGADPNRAFEKLYGLSQKLRESFPQADRISAGMSGDMAAAIRWGSTDVRVGSQIMGPRPQAV